MDRPLGFPIFYLYCITAIKGASIQVGRPIYIQGLRILSNFVGGIYHQFGPIARLRPTSQA